MSSGMSAENKDALFPSVDSEKFVFARYLVSHRIWSNSGSVLGMAVVYRTRCERSFLKCCLIWFQVSILVKNSISIVPMRPNFKKLNVLDAGCTCIWTVLPIKLAPQVRSFKFCFVFNLNIHIRAEFF